MSLMTRGHGTQHTSAAKPFNDRHPTPYRLVIFLSVALLAAVAAGQDQAQHQVSGNGPAQLPLRGPTPVDVLTSRAVSPAATPPLAATARTTWKPSEDNGLSADTSVELPILEYTVLREIRESFIDLRPDVLSGWVGEQIKCNWRKDEGCKCSWEGVSCKFQHKWGWRVSSITLASHNIGGHIPAAISDLQGLEVLNLAYNGLTGTLPPEFSSLTSLRTLYLHQNKDLTGTLPASYSELTELRNLNLGYCNFIGAVPEAWHNLPLITSLDISHNKLSGTLPVKWSNLKSLHMLSLNSNNQLIGPLPREWTSMVSHSNQELELNLYENMLLGNIPFAFNAVSDRITINFKPQNGQVSTIEKEDDNGVDLHDEDIDFLPEIFDDRLPPRNHVPALLGWLSALLVLLLLSILWLFCSRRFRLHVRRRRFASGCSSLSCIERQYLDDNHHEVLLEQSGSIRCSNGNGSGGFQSSNILMEMGVLKQPKAIQAASCQDRTVATEDSSETPRSNVSGTSALPKGTSSQPAVSRLSGAGLEDILSLQTFWKALEPPGPLGPTYSAELRGRAVVVKTVDVFDASFCAEDPCALLRLKSAARSLQDVAPHPNLLPPIATAVVRLQQGARVFLVHDFMAGGSLLDWLSGTQPAGMGAMSLPWPSRMRVAHQVVEGLVAMAARGSVHGALHPGNILLDGALHAKLVHGSITSLQVDTKSTESEATSNPSVTVIDSPFLSVAEANVPSVKGSWSLGSSAHMDPAGVSGGRPCVASDTYSLGIVLLQLLTGKADAKGLAKEVRRATATVPGLGARLTRLTFTQQEAVAALLDPYAGPWPMQSASALLSLAMACTDSRKRQRPDLKFHVLPCLAALARESAAWPLPTVGSLGSTNVRTASSLSTLTDGIPAVFLCPILREPMSNPVVASDGYTYERQAIQRWIDKAKSSGMIALSPMTNLPLLHDSIVPVHALRSEISAWMQAQSPTRSQ